ncbi:hypothetical protein D3C72_2012720 [compost metagenome]
MGRFAAFAAVTRLCLITLSNAGKINLEGALLLTRRRVLSANIDARRARAAQSVAIDRNRTDANHVLIILMVYGLSCLSAMCARTLVICG